MGDSPTAVVVGGLLLLTLTSAGLPAQEIAPPAIEIEELWATEGDGPSGPLASISGMAEAPDGRIWISDSRTDRVVALNADGTNPVVVASRGQGPGEINGPNAIYRMADGRMAINALGSHTIEFYTPAGEFEKRIHLRLFVTNPKGFVVLPSGDILLSGGIFGSDFGIHLFSPTGRVLQSWDQIPDTTDWRVGPMIAGGALAVVDDESILFSRAAPHEILLFRRDRDGRFETEGTIVASDDDLLEPIGDNFVTEGVNAQGVKLTQFYWGFPKSRAVFVLENGRIINVVQGVDEQPQTLWQLYEGLDGTLLAEGRTERYYEIWTRASNGDQLASYWHPDIGERVAARLRIKIRN